MFSALFLVLFNQTKTVLLFTWHLFRKHRAVGSTCLGEKNKSYQWYQYHNFVRDARVSSTKDWSDTLESGATLSKGQKLVDIRHFFPIIFVYMIILQWL